MRQAIPVLACAIGSAIFLTGCSGAPNAEPTAKTHGEHSGHDHKTASKAGGHDHSGWWCNEHGVPEEVCGLCDSKLAAEFQRKGDWCKEHDRPDSQCFRCHPELEAKFAALYEAKYGEKPPKPEVN